MKLSTYKCDGCGVLRSNDTNHWWLGKIVEAAILLAPFGQSWPEAVKSLVPIAHLCGVRCAIKWAQEQMGSITEKLSPSLGGKEER